LANETHRYLGGNRRCDWRFEPGLEHLHQAVGRTEALGESVAGHEDDACSAGRSDIYPRNGTEHGDGDDHPNDAQLPCLRIEAAGHEIQADQSFVVVESIGDKMPFKLEVGGEWNGYVNQDGPFCQLIADGKLWCGVYHSFAGEKPEQAQVMKVTPVKATSKKAATGG